MKKAEARPSCDMCGSRPMRDCKDYTQWLRKHKVHCRSRSSAEYDPDDPYIDFLLNLSDDGETFEDDVYNKGE